MLGPIRRRAGGGKRGGVELVGLSLSGMGRVGWVSGFCHPFFFLHHSMQAKPVVKEETPVSVLRRGSNIEKGQGKHRSAV